MYTIKKVNSFNYISNTESNAVNLRKEMFGLLI